MHAHKQIGRTQACKHTEAKRHLSVCIAEHLTCTGFLPSGSTQLLLIVQHSKPLNVCNTTHSLSPHISWIAHALKWHVTNCWTTAWKMKMFCHYASPHWNIHRGWGYTPTKMGTTGIISLVFPFLNVYESLFWCVWDPLNPFLKPPNITWTKPIAESSSANYLLF